MSCAPLLFSAAPQLPSSGVLVVKLRRAGSGVPQLQALAATHWHVSLQSCPAPQPVPHGGSHCSLLLACTMPSPQRAVVVVVVLVVVLVVVGHEAAVWGSHSSIRVSLSF